MFDPYPEFFDLVQAEKTYAEFVKTHQKGEMYPPGFVLPAVFYVRNRPGYRRGDPEGKGGTFHCGMLIIAEGNFRCVRTIAEAVMTGKIRGFDGIYVIETEKLATELVEVIELPYPEKETQNVGTESSAELHSSEHEDL